MRGQHRSRRYASVFVSLDGCEANQWPLPSERERVAERHGVTVR